MCIYIYIYTHTEYLRPGSLTQSSRQAHTDKRLGIEMARAPAAPARGSVRGPVWGSFWRGSCVWVCIKSSKILETFRTGQDSGL